MISSADRVIINGDFWDSYVTSFDKFVKSKWRALFPLLKEKNTHYNYGNHDLKKNCDERVNLFSVTQSESLTLKVGDKELLIRLGDDLDHYTPEKYPFLNKKFLTNLPYRLLAFPIYNLLLRVLKGRFYKNNPLSKKTFKTLKNWG